MKHTFTSIAIAVFAAQALVAAQGKDATQILADTRAALGGDKLAALKGLTGNGRILRTTPNGNTTENEFEVALELPDKYLMRSVLAAMGNMSVYRNSGFNGGQVIEEIDRPPNLQTGGGVMIMRVGTPGGGAMDPATMTPEQKAEFDKTRLLQNRKEYARIALGMFAASPATYPLTFTYAGEAEAPEGKADVIDVKGEGDFSVRLFVDQKSHMPLMLSWMDKEPLVMTMTSGGPGGPGGAPATGGAVTSTFTTTTSGGGGTVNVQQFAPSGGGGAAQMTPEQREKMMADLDARRKEAEAKRRTVEYRVYYADYQAVSGVLLPHKIQRSIDGKPTEEMVFDQLKVNPKIDPKKFQVAK
jgi:hypothetical protein